MDNLTHTLIGAALAESGLRRRTRYATAAMLIGANLPDVDVIAVPLGHSLEWRRGITHGVPALILWPFVLTGLILLWHRVIGARRGIAGATRGARHPGDRPPLRAGQLVLVSALAILTHPTYDWLNNYGMRWLMPIDGTWFYGDSVFIIDPYLMAILAIGVFLSRRRLRDARQGRHRPARIAVAAAGAYTVALMVLHDVAERTATRHLAADPAGAPRRVEVAPTPANPLRWRVIADRDSAYQVATVRLFAEVPFQATDLVPVGADSLRAHAARHPAAAGFLGWSRWPFYRLERDTIRVADLRYASRAGTGWAAVQVPLAPAR